MDQSRDASSPQSGIQLRQGVASKGVRSRTASKAVDGGRDVLICMYNIRDSCLYKNKCTNVHYEQPFQWQYRIGSGWRDFDAQCNNEIELNYHDPNNDVCISDYVQQDLSRFVSQLLGFLLLFISASRKAATELILCRFVCRPSSTFH